MHIVYVKNKEGDWIAQERKSDINWVTGTVVALASAAFVITLICLNIVLSGGF